MHHMGKDARLGAISEWLRQDDQIRWLVLGAQRYPARWAALHLELQGLSTAAARALKSALEATSKSLATSGTKETRLEDLTDRGLLPPPGYVVDEDGVWLEETGEQLATRPLYIVGRGRNVIRQTDRFVTLRWAEGKQWDELMMGRASATSSKGLQEVGAAAGAPVTSANALALTRYLDAFETSNMDALPSALVTHRMGWQPNGAFVWGTTSFGSFDKVELLDPHKASDWRTIGDEDGWRRAFGVVSGLPLMVLAVIASVAAPLLHILDQEGFIVDWSGETSHGKTTALNIAASVWGSPEREAPAGPMGQWASAKGSSVGHRGAAAFRHSLPLILDDTKTGQRDVIAQCAYELPAGRDASRGDRDGTERVPSTWRTVILSCGEARLSSFTQAGGARARVLDVVGAPMGPKTEANGARAEHVKSLLLANFGHLGPQVVTELLARPDYYRARFSIHRNHRGAALAGAARRVAVHLAVLDTARELAEAAGMPTPKCDPVGFAAECIAAGASTADPPTEALRSVLTWLASIPHRVHGCEPDGRHQGVEYVGAWAKDTAWREIYLVEQTLKEQLDRMGYDSASVMEAWASRKWRRLDGKGKNPQARGAFGDPKQRPRLVAILRSAVVDIGDDERDELVYFDEDQGEM